MASDSLHKPLLRISCRFFSRYKTAGGGGGNRHFVHQCNLMAKLFRDMVRSRLHSLYAELEIRKGAPSGD